MSVSRTDSEIFSVNGVTLKSGLQVTQSHWNWYQTKTWVRFPIHLP